MGRLDEILRAQPATLPPPAPTRQSKRFDYTGYMQRHPVAQVAADRRLMNLAGKVVVTPDRATTI